MKSILTQIFVALGVMFVILILAGVYFFVTDPFNVKPMIFGSGPVQNIPKSTQSTPADTTVTPSEATTLSTQGGFTLSDAQKQALVSFGIDPTTVPSSISAEKETCFVGVLGEARVGEIKAGAVPSAFEFLKAKSCI